MVTGKTELLGVWVARWRNRRKAFRLGNVWLSLAKAYRIGDIDYQTFTATADLITELINRNWEEYRRIG